MPGEIASHNKVPANASMIGSHEKKCPICRLLFRSNAMCCLLRSVFHWILPPDTYMFLIQHRHPHTNIHKNPTHFYRNTHIHALHSYTHRQLVISSIIPVTHFCIHVHACVQTLQTRAGLYLSICHLLQSKFTIYFNTLFFNKYLYMYFTKQNTELKYISYCWRMISEDFY